AHGLGVAPRGHGDPVLGFADVDASGMGVADLEGVQQFPKTRKSKHSSGIPTCLFVNHHAKMWLSGHEWLHFWLEVAMGIVVPKVRKHLCADALLRSVHDVFCHLPEHRKGDPEIPLSDVLMSAFAMFSLK